MNPFRAGLPALARKYVWNAKYTLLGYPHLLAPEDAIQFLASQLPASGSLLELGCGRGSLIRGMRQAGWMGQYCGVDISQQAIRDANKFGDQRSSWIVSDFESFRSPFQWNAIAMIESIYYLRLDQVPLVLERLMGMLGESGMFLARFHDFNKHRSYVELIQDLYPGAERVENNLLCITAATVQFNPSSSQRCERERV